MRDLQSNHRSLAAGAPPSEWIRDPLPRSVPVQPDDPHEATVGRVEDREPVCVRPERQDDSALGGTAATG